MLSAETLAMLMAGLPGFDSHNADIDTNIAILTEAQKLAQSLLVENGKQADNLGCVLASGRVKLPLGQRQSWRALCEGGWTSLADPVAFGGQGLALPMLRLFGLACIDGLLRRHKDIVGDALLAWHHANLAAKAASLVALADWVDTDSLYAELA